MSITAPIEVEPQQHSNITVNDLVVIDDDIAIVPNTAPADATVALHREPLLPFLVLGVVNLIAMLAISFLLAF